MHFRKTVLLQTRHPDIGIRGPSHLSHANKSAEVRVLSSIEESESIMPGGEQQVSEMILFSKSISSSMRELSLITLNILWI
jgi:hypothetical protein